MLVQGFLVCQKVHSYELKKEFTVWVLKCLLQNPQESAKHDGKGEGWA